MSVPMRFVPLYYIFLYYKVGVGMWQVCSVDRNQKTN